MRRSGQPFLVAVEGQTWTSRGLERLLLDKKVMLNGQEVDERWLQNILDQAPSLLPVDSVDERVLPPLFSLGTEISTLAGSIDNLFLSKNGYLVVVETKLWRNQEARRTVVAQILDYATHLREWRYTELEKLWKEREELRKKLGVQRDDSPESLWQAVKPEDLEEHKWIDEVNNNLSSGRMTLLVVGDGIQTQAEKLAESVSGHPGFLFRLGLIEIQLYQVSGNQIFVLPTTLARTSEIERAVVRVAYIQQPAPNVSVEVPTVGLPSKPQRQVLNEEAFRAELLSSGPDGRSRAEVVDRILSLLQNTDLQVNWTDSSFVIKLPDPSGSGTLLSMGVFSRQTGGIFYCYISWLQGQLPRIWSEATGSVERVLDAFRSFLRHFEAKPSPKGDEHRINLSTLSGKEDAFVEGLNKVVSIIQEEARIQSSAPSS